MIFRKPYAILIKNFKLIHIVLTLFVCYLIYGTYSINSFFNEYMQGVMLPVGKGATDQLFSALFFIIPIFIIIFSIIMFFTMRKKEKPKALYTFLIIIYIVIIAMFNYTKTKVLYLEDNILPIKEIRLLSDISLMILLPQIILVGFLLVRSIGFDIKKFDFKKDLLDMDIQDADNEEFEVSFILDSNVFKRKFYKTIRDLKYIYLENKIIFIIISLVVISFFSYNTYQKLNLESKILKENGEAFFVDNTTIQIKNSYITKKDYKDNLMTNGNYVIVKLIVKASSLNTTLNFAKIQLKTGSNVYYPVENGLIKEFKDLGRVYSNEKLNTKEFQTYLLLYELPLGEKSNNITFRYVVDKNEDKLNMITIALKPLKLDIETKTKNVKLNEEITLNDKILGKSKIKVNSIEQDNFFVNKYRYCASGGECYQSIEYIRPVLNSNVDKALLKISGELKYDEDFSIYGIKDFKSLISNFGTLVYKYNDKTYKVKNGISWVEPKKYKVKNEYYMEVNKNVLEASEVYMLIKIREKEYKFNLKN